MSYGLLRRWSEAARSAVIRDRRRPRRVFAQTDIEPGWAVVDGAGESVGTVDALESDWLEVRRGILHRRLYVPFHAIREVHEGIVRLNTGITEVEEQRWSERPRGSNSDRIQPD
jgi:hypothetical protein